MIAKFENRKLAAHSHVSAQKYETLQNLPHWHMEYELVFCDYGTARVFVGSEQYILTEGHCLFIGSGEIHKIQSLSESVISVIKMEQSLVEQAFHGKHPACPLIRTQLPLADIFAEISAEINGTEPFSVIVCDCLIMKTLAQLFRNCALRHEQKTGAGEKYKALLRMLEERFADITFEEAAAFMCYSKPYFSRYFSRITGMSFSSYVNILRVARAVSLITERKHTMTEIAHAAGFGTVRHFNRVFRELTGFSPSELPADYVFIQHRGTAEGFDPTLSAPAMGEASPEGRS